MKHNTKHKIKIALLLLTITAIFTLGITTGLADGNSDISTHSVSSENSSTSVEGLSGEAIATPLASSSGTLGAEVSWSVDPVENKLIIYPTNGVSGKIPDQIEFPWKNDYSVRNVSSIEIQGTIFAGENIDGMFTGFWYISTIEGIENLDVSGTTSAKKMFSNCADLRTLDVSDWNTSNITNMQGMFSGCQSLSQLDVSRWDTGNVTDMSEMFSGILYWSDTQLLLDVSDWDTGNVTNMSGLFQNAYNYSNALDVSRWDTSNVTDMSNMFTGCRNVAEINVSGWNTSNVTDMSEIFSGCSRFTAIDVSRWDVSKVTNMHSTFTGCENLETLDVSEWNTSKLTDTVQLFSGCSNLKALDVSRWDTSNVTDMYSMFASCSSLTELNVIQWDTSEVDNMFAIFADCSSLIELDVSQWNTSKVLSMGNTFNGCSSLTELNISQWNTSNVTDLSQMFKGCSAVTVLDINQWDTSNVTAMYSVFDGCESVEQLDVSQWDTSNVQSMEFMFQNTSSLKKIDVSNFTTEKVQDMRYMFNGTGVSEIDVSNFSDNSIEMGFYGYEKGTLNMFSNAPNLRKVNISSFKRSDPRYSINLFTNSPVTELILGDSYKIEPTDLSVEQFSDGALTGYSNEWLYLGTPEVLYKDGDDFLSGYNSAQSAGTYIRMGITYSIELDANSGVLSDGRTERTIPARYKVNPKDGVSPTEINDPSYKKGYEFMGWNTEIDGSGVSYPNATEVENLTTTAGSTVVFYAQWKAIPYIVTFDMNGAPITSETQISTYESLLSEPTKPLYSGYIFDGWYKESVTTTLWDFATDSMPAEDITVYAKWVSIADLIHITNENVVIYKNESTAEEVEQAVGITVDSYTDYQGTVHSFTGILEWNPVWISEGGVNEMKIYVNDPNSQEKIYSHMDSYLYVLNRPYAEGIDTIYIFEGEFINPDDYFVVGYGEVPNFAEKRIDRTKIDLTLTKDSVDVWEKGTYYAAYTGSFGDLTFNFPVTVIVRMREGLTREEQLQVDSSDFWLKVTTIYHSMEAGQIVDVTPLNYMDGGVLRAEKVSTGSSYDRQLNVEVGKYIYMSPNILNMLDEEEMGQLNINLEGRSWIFSSDTTETAGKDFPKGYYNLRMSLDTKEEITSLVGTETPQMQLQFEMNRPWFATPTFVIPPNDSVKSAVESGATPYLFHYNENTNELELVGAMTLQKNGNLSIPMNGVYKNYVILTSLPANGSYRITEHSNALDSQTYTAVANNIIDSGHVLPGGSGLNGISTTKYAQILDRDVISKKSSNVQRILKIAGFSALGLTILCVGTIFWKKRKRDELD